MIALSIRQPWAWLIVNGYKDVENRTWATSFRGGILIHAGNTMTRGEYAECRDFALRINPAIPFPVFEALERGGIVGIAQVTGCVAVCESPWFVGDFGFLLAEPRILAFRATPGQIGFFNVKTEVFNG